MFAYPRNLALAVLLSTSCCAHAELPDSAFSPDGIKESAESAFDLPVAGMPVRPDGTLPAEQLDAGFGSGGRVHQTVADQIVQGVSIFGRRDGRYVSFMTVPLGQNIDFINVALRDADGSIRIGRGYGSANIETTVRSAFDSRERLVVAGTTSSLVGPVAKFRVFRFQYVDASTGYVKDTSFGTNGVVDVAFDGFSARAQAVAIDGNDDIFIAGEVSFSATDTDFAIAKLRGGNGSLDTSFSTTGTRTVAFDVGTGDLLDSAHAIAIAPNDAAITVVGSAFDDVGGKFRVAMARLLPNGILDASFCPGSCTFNPHPSLHDGRRTYYFGSAANAADNTALAITHLANGDLVVAGQSQPVAYGPSSGAVARFSSAGSFRSEVLETVPDRIIAYSSVRAVDAVGSRILVSGTKHLTVPGEAQIVLQAFDGSTGFLSRSSGFGNCLTGNSAQCFTGSGDSFDWHDDKNAMIAVDPLGRALIAGTFIHYTNPDQRPLASFFRFTNSSGPKPDLIFRNGFQ